MAFIDWAIRTTKAAGRGIVKLANGIGKAAINTYSIVLSLPNNIMALFFHSEVPFTERLTTLAILGAIMSNFRAIRENRSRMRGEVEPVTSSRFWHWMDLIKNVGYTFEMLLNTCRQVIIFTLVMLGKPKETELNDWLAGFLPLTIFLSIASLSEYFKRRYQDARHEMSKTLRFIANSVASLTDGVNLWVIANSLMAMFSAAGAEITTVETRDEAEKNLIIGGICLGMSVLAYAIVKGGAYLFPRTRLGSGLAYIEGKAKEIGVSEGIEKLAAGLSGVKVAVDASKGIHAATNTTDTALNSTRLGAQIVALAGPLVANLCITGTIDGEVDVGAAGGGHGGGGGPGDGGDDDGDDGDDNGDGHHPSPPKNKKPSGQKQAATETTALTPLSATPSYQATGVSVAALTGTKLGFFNTHSAAHTSNTPDSVSVPITSPTSEPQTITQQIGVHVGT